MEKKLMKGNVAIAEAAIHAGCKCFFGYPITPQNELIEHMSKRLLKLEDGVFVQSESEVAAINMVFGAAGAGARVMTSSSGPGLSLKQEGISFLAGAELPAVIVNVMRGGPGLGGIQPAQSDYFQATRGGGHGDYYTMVYAPANVQEAVDLVQKAFDKADEYRNPVIILADGVIGQMMEPAEIKDNDNSANYKKDWAVTGKEGSHNILRSLYLDPHELNIHNKNLTKKYEKIEANEIMFETAFIDDADIMIVAYGTTSRIARSAIREAREKGIKVGLFRPITLWPFPLKELKEAAKNTKNVVVAEMSSGQMIYDVKLALEGSKPVSFVGEAGGIIPTTKQILEAIELASKEE
ncbi:MAG: 3-methyl-2-oxobutanoate dehydrogenase subunit VorB [Bacilli bacterium]|jgi:2-oxoglutarate ferredoxin oxidoreductase subunit alpha|nr:3-methyl-2-oxobutanoate dehydrogenase subunit VorB [Bacilli bacterium]